MSKAVLKQVVGEPRLEKAVQQSLNNRHSGWLTSPGLLRRGGRPELDGLGCAQSPAAWNDSRLVNP
jgi:hypothetical protein